MSCASHSCGIPDPCMRWADRSSLVSTSPQLLEDRIGFRGPRSLLVPGELLHPTCCFLGPRASLFFLPSFFRPASDSCHTAWVPRLRKSHFDMHVAHNRAADWRKILSSTKNDDTSLGDERTHDKGTILLHPFDFSRMIYEEYVITVPSVSSSACCFSSADFQRHVWRSLSTPRGDAREFYSFFVSFVTFFETTKHSCPLFFEPSEPAESVTRNSARPYPNFHCAFFLEVKQWHRTFLVWHFCSADFNHLPQGFDSCQLSCRVNTFEEPVNVLLDAAALRQLHQDFCQRNWADLAWAWLRQLLPRLRLLRSTVKRSNCGRRPEFSCLVWNHSLRPHAHPFTQHGWSPLRASNGRDVCLPPTAGARLRCQHNTLAMRFTSFAGGDENFIAACLIVAHCILIRAVSCSSVSTATSECTSPAVCMFGGARVFVRRIGRAARMLQESILSEARIVSAFSAVLCCKVWVPSPRASASRANISRTYKRKSSVHAPVSANAARFPADSKPISPSLTACSPPSQARSSSVGPSQAHLAAASSSLRDSESRLLAHCWWQFVWSCSSCLSKAHVLCLRPRGWCLMVRIAGNDVANSSSRSSVQLLTAVGSGASALPCSSAWPARGVAMSICVCWPVSAGPAAAQPGGPRVRPAPAYHLGPRPSGRRSPASRSATHEACLKPRCRQAPRSRNFDCSQATQPLSDGSSSCSQQLAHTPPSTLWHFVHVYPFFFGCEGGFAGSAHLVAPLDPFRLASHHKAPASDLALVLWVSPVWSTVPRPDTRMSSQSRSASVSKAGISAHVRGESVSSSVSLRFCMTLVVKSWTCENVAHPFANATSPVVRVFFCCGAHCARPCVAASAPLGACASSNSAISSASPSSRSHSIAAPPSWDRIADEGWRMSSTLGLRESVGRVVVLPLDSTCFRKVLSKLLNVWKDLTRFTLTCGAGITGNEASCMSLCKSMWVCTTSCCACSKFAWALSMASCAFSPASTAPRNLSRAWSILWPMGWACLISASSFSALHSKMRM